MGNIASSTQNTGNKVLISVLLQVRGFLSEQYIYVFICLFKLFFKPCIYLNYFIFNLIAKIITDVPFPPIVCVHR